MRFSLSRTGRTFLAAGLSLGAASLSASCGGSDGSGGGDGGQGAMGGGGGGVGGVDAPDASTAGTAGMAGTAGSGGQMMIDAGPGGASGAGGTDGQVIIPTSCGNQIIEPGEQCDDGNDVSGDGCENTCLFTCSPGPVGDAACSDNDFCNGHETCNNNNMCDPGTPRPDDLFCGENRVCRSGVCSRPDAVCGDGIVIRPEDCEDGITLGDAIGDGDGCDTDCRFSCSDELGGKPCVAAECEGSPRCDNFTHTCLPGIPAVDFTPCGTTGDSVCINQVCTSEYCSNGTTDTGEDCDDGNLAGGDGCEADCTFTCTASDESACSPDGTDRCRVNGGCDTVTNTCNPLVNKANGTKCGNEICISGNCRSNVCGDGVVADSEACDDQNLASGDGCVNCQFECTTPGDCTDPPECMQMDCVDNACVPVPDGSADASSCAGGAGTCASGACTAGTCGDGIVDGGEDCDQGTDNGLGFGCTAECRFECAVAADCDDGDACGTETCEDVLGTASDGGPIVIGKQCARSNAVDGSACGGGAPNICVGGFCRVGFCGDGFTDVGAGEECDPPLDPTCSLSCEAQEICDLNGEWAMKLEVAVTWPIVDSGGQELLRPGSGTIVSYALVTMTQPAATPTSLTTTVQPCGLVIPDFQTGANLTGTFVEMANETYGLVFPDPLFDSGTIPLVTGTVSIGGLSPGSTFFAPATSVQIGVAMDQPFGTWGALVGPPPEIEGATLTDPDGDGLPGAAADVKTGAVPDPAPGDATDYSYVDVNPLAEPDGRAQALSLSVRQVASQSGVINDCDSISGNLSVTSMDSHVVGCIDAPVGTPSCSDPLTTLLTDNARPKYAPGAGSFEAVRLTSGASCSDVRGAAFSL